MVTNEERCEVARRLRELDYSDLQESLICAYLDALGIEGYADWVGISHRLADLIEPAPERTYHPERIGTAYHSALMCSACKYPLDDVTIYCPHCGARLEGVGR